MNTSIYNKNLTMELKTQNSNYQNSNRNSYVYRSTIHNGGALPLLSVLEATDGGAVLIQLR